MKSPLKIIVSIPRTLGFHPDDESFFHPRCSLLRFLRFFTCVSWGISSAQILLIVETTAIRHSIFYFSSFSMFIQSRISKSVVICSFCSFLCSFLLFFLFPVLFSPSVYSFYFLISLIVFFSDLLSFLFSFPITLFCLFSLMLCYYSICSLSISLHLFRSLYLILLCHLFCSCFCFLYTSSFW